MDSTRIRTEFILDFGEGYRAFGLSRLMGQIVGLLLCEDQPQSLNVITERLAVSKGPVSQITRRLRDHALLRKVPIAGSRRDHYAAEPDIFGRAYRNHAEKQVKNLELARRYQARLAESSDASNTLRRRVAEMAAFYELMLEHQKAFMEAWARRRAALECDAESGE